MPLEDICASVREIPRVSSKNLTPDEFQKNFFTKAKPVIITEATDDWPARKWTIESLRDRVGKNEVWVRGQTNQPEYHVGRKYTIRKDTFGSYCDDLLKSNARARSSYLAVASIQQFFPGTVFSNA